MSKHEKRKHHTLTLFQKAEILKKLDYGFKARDLATYYSVGQPTIYDIKKNRERIEKFVKDNDSNTCIRKTLKTSDYPQVEDALYSWFLEERNRCLKVTKEMIKGKAKCFYKEIMQKDDFRASDGWFEKFKKRYGIRLLSITVPQPPPAQKQPALQQPQPQPQKIMPPQQVQAPKPIAPKPPQATQPVSPLQPLPPPPEVCLRWNSYHSNMQATFPSLLNNEQFVDVTLACEGRSIKCHKMMLSACSAYFEELLSQNPCQHPIVLMKDLRYWEVQALVDFMYRGEVNVGQDKLPSLLAAAEALQIKGLAGPAFSSNDDDNSQAAAPASTGEEYLDESIPSPSSARRARKRRVMSSNVPPRVQTPQSQPIPTSPKNTSSKRPVKPISVPSTSSSYEIESSSLLSEPPVRRHRKTDTDLVGEIKIEPIDIEISNDSMDQIEESFLEKTYDESGGEESNCLSNDPGGTSDSRNLELGDVKSLHGHETDPLEYGTNNSASGSDHNFKYEDSGSQDASLGPISDMPGTSYQ